MYLKSMIHLLHHQLSLRKKLKIQKHLEIVFEAQLQIQMQSVLKNEGMNFSDGL